MEELKNLKRTFGLRLISVVNGVAACIHLLFWIMAFIHLSHSASEIGFAPNANLATTYGFGIADILWSIPFLTIGCVGLWNLKPFGWLAAQFANVLYWYSLSVILTKDLLTNSVSPGTILFLPFAIFSFWAAPYLWKVKNNFFNQNN